MRSPHGDGVGSPDDERLLTSPPTTRRSAPRGPTTSAGGIGGGQSQTGTLITGGVTALTCIAKNVEIATRRPQREIRRLGGTIHVTATSVGVGSSSRLSSSPGDEVPQPRTTHARDANPPRPEQSSCRGQRRKP